MIKRNSHNDAQVTQQKPSEQYEQYFSDDRSEWQYRKMSPEDLEQFCERLGNFLKQMRNIQQLTYLTYDGPSILQSRLEKDANELQSLYMELKDAVTNINRLKKQKKTVKKEKSCLKKALNKLHEEEVRRMENEISMYDKTMFVRWESIKNTHKPEVLGILLNDVKGKQQALKHLHMLISHRLKQLQISVPENAALASTPVGTTPTISLASNRDSRAGAGSINNLNINTMPHGSCNTYRSESCHRKRKNQEQENHNSTSTSQFTIQEECRCNDMPLLPFTVESSPFQILGTSIILPVNTIPTRTESSHGTADTTNTLQNNGISNSDSNTNMGSEFQIEMRTVIQALFGQLHQSSPTAIIIRNPERENDNTSQEIELYTIRGSQSPPS